MKNIPVRRKTKQTLFKFMMNRFQEFFKNSAIPIIYSNFISGNWRTFSVSNLIGSVTGALFGSKLRRILWGSLSEFRALESIKAFKFIPFQTINYHHRSCIFSVKFNSTRKWFFFNDHFRIQINDWCQKIGLKCTFKTFSNISYFKWLIIYYSHLLYQNGCK